MDDRHEPQTLETGLGVVDFDAVCLLPANDEQLVVEYRHSVDSSVTARKYGDGACALCNIIISQLTI